MNKKGQALVEFIIIMPVIILLLLSVVDFVKIQNEKIDLENMLDEAIINEPIESDKITKNSDNGKITYTAKNEVDIFSPFLTPILGENYIVSVSRVIYE